MTIEEAIKHCEEVEEQKRKQISDTLNWGINYFDGECEVILDECDKEILKCADEHRQLAEWLKELKAYRKAEKEIEQELEIWNDIDNGKVRGLFLATSIIQHYKNEEVKADG